MQQRALCATRTAPELQNPRVINHDGEIADSTAVRVLWWLDLYLGPPKEFGINKYAKLVLGFKKAYRVYMYM